MSLETWKKKYYPIEASEVPEKDALAHSLQKWIGLREKNLDKHEVSHHGWYIECDHELDILDIDGDTCALCYHYETGSKCPKCPLVKVAGRRCDQGGDAMFNGDKYSPYEEFVKNKNPEPMIKLIRSAIKAEESK